MNSKHLPAITMYGAMNDGPNNGVQAGTIAAAR
jgi:hypothetical protein